MANKPSFTFQAHFQSPCLHTGHYQDHDPFFNAKTNRGIGDLCFVPKSERQKAIVGFVPEST